MLSNCAGEVSWESLGQWGEWTSQSYRKETLNILRKGWCWRSNTLATWCKEPTHWKRPWCWGTLRAGEGGDRLWDGWMASPTQWTWVWANSQDTVKGREAWNATVHGVTESGTQLSDWTTVTSLSLHCCMLLPLDLLIFAFYI